MSRPNKQCCERLSLSQICKDLECAPMHALFFSLGTSNKPLLDIKSSCVLSSLPHLLHPPRCTSPLYTTKSDYKEDILNVKILLGKADAWSLFSDEILINCEQPSLPLSLDWQLCLQYHIAQNYWYFNHISITYVLYCIEVVWVRLQIQPRFLDCLIGWQLLPSLTPPYTWRP